MENTIVIECQSEEMRAAANALKIRNEFMKLGFQTRTSFIEIIQEYLEEYKGYRKVGVLQSWWLLRVKDEEINQKLETVLNKLRHE